MVPYLAIAAFAGLRAQEIKRLDWAEIHLSGSERDIEVKASKFKNQFSPPGAHQRQPCRVARALRPGRRPSRGIGARRQATFPIPRPAGRRRVEAQR